MGSDHVRHYRTVHHRPAHAEQLRRRVPDSQRVHAVGLRAPSLLDRARCTWRDPKRGIHACHDSAGVLLRPRLETANGSRVGPGRARTPGAMADGRTVPDYGSCVAHLVPGDRSRRSRPGGPSCNGPGCAAGPRAEAGGRNQRRGERRRARHASASFRRRALMALPTPVIALLPEYVLTVAGVLIMLVEAVLKPGTSRKPLGWLAIAATVITGCIGWFQIRLGTLSAFSGSIQVDRFSIFFQIGRASCRERVEIS